MTALLSLALKNWKLVAIGGLVALLLVVLGAHRVIVAGWESDLADEVKKHAACKVDKKTLDDALTAANKAVEDFRDKEAAKQAEAEKRAQEARERASRDRKREAADDRAGPERMNAFMKLTFGD